MQNNFQQQQNMMVNQGGPVVGHIIQNNGIVTNSMPHEAQMVQQNNMVVEPQQQQQQPMQAVPQSAPPAAVQQQQQHIHTQNSSIIPNNKAQTSSSTSSEPPQVVTKQRLQDLVREIDQTLNLEDDVEEILLSYVDEFVDRCLNGASLIAKNRNCNSIEVKDVQQFLNRNYNMWTPGFGTDELRPYKRSLTTDAHKQRTALIRKTMKKY